MATYMIVTLNGRCFRFQAEEMEEIDGLYIFTNEGEVVAQFKKDNIAGWFLVATERYE